MLHRFLGIFEIMFVEKKIGYKKFELHINSTSTQT